MANAAGRIRYLAWIAALALCACGDDAEMTAAMNAPDGGGPGNGAQSGGGGSSAAGAGGAHASGGSTASQMGSGGMPGTGGRSGSGGSGGAGSAVDAGTDAGTDAGATAATCPGQKPDASNTGVPKGVKLTVVDHDVTITEDDAAIDAQDIHGFLIIDADRVHVTRSIVRGGMATQNGAGILVRSGSDIAIEDTEVALEHPSAWLDGISGDHLTVRRSNVHGGVDGMKVGSNSRVECSFIHDMQSFESDPNQGGGATHNDAIQILAGTNIRIVGNQLLASKDQNAAIQVTQDFGAVGDLEIEGNWADGGGCTFNFSHNGGDGLDVTTRDNRFGRNSFYDCPILKSTKTTLHSSGDVWDDDNTEVPVQTHD